MSSSEPDWERLRQISAEIDGLIADGKWTKVEYLRLLDEGAKAAAGDDELLEFIVNAGVQFDL